MKLWGKLFGRKSFDLSQITPEEIRTDEITLERQERKLESEIDACQGRIDAIVNETVAAGKRSQARSATRKIMQLKERIADKERALKGISKSLRALGRLSLLTQSAASLAPSGVLARLHSLPQGDLSRLLCGEMAEAEARERGLDSIVEMLSAYSAMDDGMEGDPEAASLQAAFERAIDAGDPTLVAALIAEDAEPAEWAAPIATI